MPAVSVDQVVISFKPASYTVTETKTLFTVRDAYLRVTSVDVRVEKAFSAGAPTISVGVAGAVSDLVKTTDVTIATPGVYKGTGTGTASGGGALYAPGTAIIVTYTADASTTGGLARIAITALRVGI